ncbi:TolC family protein [Sphingobium sp. HBC34]|uniref:TolC family protein n=1 Tax=Sphingobium cyanobacteriorum TaxID=3063954 RepID=A0ABT8ZIS4_9SPHN|nr:TolC family protein [Sphingobium sp. HBC34]MDO7834111.1 TolC family protein [Sphingobium sp. HBC34]
MRLLIFDLSTRHGRRRVRQAATLVALLGIAHPLAIAAQDRLVVPPNPRPFSAPAQDDPLLALANSTTADSLFRSEVEAAVQNNALIDEARAGEREAQAARVQARSLLFPTVDLSVDANRSLARNFANDIGNIIERSRPQGRTDATASIRQRLLDFGAASSRINAGNARVEAARSATQGYGQDVAIRTITAWYSILAQRLMEQAAVEYVDRQQRLRAAIGRRIANGFSARGEFPRIDSSIANVQTRLAGFRRDRASAEAQYRSLTGHDAPAGLGRAPLPRPDIDTPDALEALVLQSPVVLRAEAEARGARQDARAARSERLPTIAAGVDAGRYGVFENPGDYDIRGRIIVRAQLGAGINAKADQATARADAANAYAERVRQETLRDAQMALADLKGLEAQFAAAQAGYLANRAARDVVATRFEAAQGSVTDLLYAEDSYFYSITIFIQTLAERDVSRFALLAKSGLLLAELGIRVDPLDRMAKP